jgi:hypothetical protein
MSATRATSKRHKLSDIAFMSVPMHIVETYRADINIYEANPYAYVSSDHDGIVWYCGHRHRTDDAAARCLPAAERVARQMNAEAKMEAGS